MTGTNHEILRDFLHQLRDFSIKAGSGPCFLYELSEDKHREAMDVIRELTEAGVITGGHRAFAVMGDEITPLVRYCSEWTVEEFNHHYYTGKTDDSQPTLDEDIMAFENWREDKIINIVEDLNWISPEEWDKEHGTNYSEQIYQLQHEKLPTVIGLEVGWGKDGVFIEKNNLGHIVNNPLRYGVNVTSVNANKLREFCKEKHLKLPKLPPERKIFVSLSFSDLMQPCVFIEGRKYIGTGLNDGSRAAAIIEYMKDKERFGQKVSIDELLEEKILASRKNTSLKSTIFRHNPFNRDRDDNRPAPLAPFATILESDTIQIDTRTLLTRDEAELIKNTFKQK